MDNRKRFRRKVKKLRMERKKCADIKKKEVVVNKIEKERSILEERIIAMRQFIARTERLKRAMLSVRKRTSNTAFVFQGSYNNVWVVFASDRMVGNFRNRTLKDLMIKDKEVLKAFPELNL